MDTRIGGMNEKQMLAYLGCRGDAPEELASKLAVKISFEMARAAHPYADGCYIMPPFSRTALVCRIMNEIRSGKKQYNLFYNDTLLKRHMKTYF